MTKDSIAQALRGLPAFTPGALVWSSVCDTFASIKVSLPETTDRAAMDRVAADAHRAIRAHAQQAAGGLDSFIVEFVDHAGAVLHSVRYRADGAVAPPPAAASADRKGGHTPSGGGAGGGGGGVGGASGGGHAPIPGLNAKNSALPGVRHVVAVGAGKGGVGKSTIALNLAVGLARRGHAVGLLDADIYGPSMPTMLGLASLEAMVHEGMLQPFFVHGVKCMTIGKLVEAEKPLIWRGPMAHGAFKQLAEQTNWGDLDYLIIDLPPGTGDISLTMAQMLTLAGAVVVCTPQKVAQDDAVRAARMFQQLNVAVLGVVENMSTFIGDDGKAYDIFGKGGAEMMAQRLGVPFLGAVPITMALRENSDKGDPSANFSGEGPAGLRLRESLDELVRNVEAQVALTAMRSGVARPTLSIS